VDPRGKSIQPFPIAPGASYASPRYVAACVTRLPGGGPDVYLEYGGADGWGVEKLKVLSDVSAMVVPQSWPPPGAGAAPPRIAPLGNGGALPARVQAAMACGPDGKAWVFGGLADVGGTAKTQWRPTADLSRVSVSGGPGGLSLAAAALGAAAGGPPPRYGAAMAFLLPEVVGNREGSLLLIGGINGTDPELSRWAAVVCGRKGEGGGRTWGNGRALEGRAALAPQ
jgi:hypothetical protein